MAAMCGRIPGHRFLMFSTTLVNQIIASYFCCSSQPEHALQILSVFEILGKDARSVGVVDHVLAKVFLIFENVMNESTESKCRSCTQRRISTIAEVQLNRGQRELPVFLARALTTTETNW